MLQIHQLGGLSLTLQAVAILSFLANNIEHGIDQFGTLRVMTLGPVVTGAGLAEDEVIWPENLSEGARSDGIHGSRLQIHEDRAWYVPSTACLVVIHIDPLQLQVRVAVVPPRRVDAVLVADHLPELGSDLVPALPSLYVKDFSHFHNFSKGNLTWFAIYIGTTEINQGYFWKIRIFVNY